MSDFGDPFRKEGPPLHFVKLGPPIEVGATNAQPAVVAVSGFNVQAGVSVSHNGGGVGVDVDSTGVAVRAKGATLAGLFQGDVEITGNVRCSGDVVLTGADCAEHFDATPDAMCEPGTVMTISIGGALDASSSAYDKKVAGVVSGAGNFRPAIILDKQPSDSGRPPVALSGKVYCKVDAEYAAIEIGDLLTTSDTLGHAMKASEPQRAFGAVVGKALGPLASGRGIIPILVSLQ